MSENKTPEEKAAEAKANETESSQEDLKKQIDQLAQDKSSLTNEIKEIRKEKGELKQDVEALKEAVSQNNSKQPEPEGSTDVKTVVQSVLAEEKSSRAKSNKEKAIEKFINSNKEFHPDNDPTGLKRDALDKALGRFNLSNAVEVEEFSVFIEDANRLLGGKDTTAEISKEKEIKNPYASSPSSKPTPTVVVDKDLTPEEKEVVEKHGFSKEKFLRLKERYPQYVEGLLSN